MELLYHMGVNIILKGDFFPTNAHNKRGYFDANYKRFIIFWPNRAQYRYSFGKY